MTGRPLPYYRTPSGVVRQNGAMLAASVAGTVVVLRAWLHTAPDADFNVGAFNIHHLFTGLVLIVIGGVPLAIFRGHTPRLRVALVTFGVGLGMALDEWVYLIATDGSNASYLLPVSFWGATAVVGLALAYAGTLVVLRIMRPGATPRTRATPGG